MSAALEEVTEKALKLPLQERLALANRLSSAEETTASSAIEAAREEEILARIEAINNGSAVGVPYEEVLRAAGDRRTEAG
jgi:chorismate mutase